MGASVFNRGGDDGFEIVGEVEYLRARHERGLLRRQVGCEVLMKLRGIQVSEAVCRLLYRTRLLRALGKRFPSSASFSSVWHVGCDVHQSDNGWIHPSFGNYGSPIAVSDKNARSVLKSEGPLGGSHVFFKPRLRLLNDADVVAILRKNVVNALPAGTICSGTMNQNNIPNAMLVVLR
jgi:hypothetical protein